MMGTANGVAVAATATHYRYPRVCPCRCLPSIVPVSSIRFSRICLSRTYAAYLRACDRLTSPISTRQPTSSHQRLLPILFLFSPFHIRSAQSAAGLSPPFSICFLYRRNTSNTGMSCAWQSSSERAEGLTVGLRIRALQHKEGTLWYVHFYALPSPTEINSQRSVRLATFMEGKATDATTYLRCTSRL